jgi:predicted acylesterase/phospholipase RssA/CRP-like cAMP-binding protein
LFAALPERALARLAANARRVHVPAHRELFHQGDAADGVAVVLSGRLHVLQRDDGDRADRVVGVLGRGSWVGELSLLTGAPRSATVRAVRDSDLLVITPDDFDALVSDEPELGVALARTVAAQLQQSRTAAVATAAPNTLGIIPLGDQLPIAELTAAVVDALERYGSVRVDHGDGPGDAPADESADERHRRWARRLDQHEREHDLVVLVAERPDDDRAWAAFCARSTDRTMAVLRGGRPPAWAGVGGDVPLTHCDLVFVGSSVSAGRMASGRQALAPRAVHLVPEGPRLAAAAGRAARRVSEHALGLVLSGGGARGLAHLGVLEVLAERDVTIDRVGGCSAGAVAAGLLALGWSTSRMAEVLRVELVEHHPFADYTVPRESLIRGRRALSMLQRLFGDARIEELPLPFFAVSADLESGDLVVHRDGSLRDAVAASMAIPGFAPPIRIDTSESRRPERLLVDGGLLDNFPVDVMVGMREGPVVGVDVMRDYPADGEHGEMRGIVATLARSMVLGGWHRAEENRDLADLLISPAVADIGLFEFDRMDDAVAAGRAAAAEAIDADGLPA